MAESSAGWVRKKVSAHTEKLEKPVGGSKKAIFVKSGGAIDTKYPGYGDVTAEYASYARLRPYLRMPRVRLLRGGTQGTRLVVQNVLGTPLNEVLKQGEMEELQRAFRSFTTDLISMWRNTLQPMDENQLVPERNLRVKYLERIGTLRSSSAIQELLNKQMVINGRNYPRLGEILEQSETFLRNNREPFMSYAHGDEMLQNIISTPDSPSKYMTIDPRSAAAGYYTPAQSANYLIGLTFLYDYDCTASYMQVHDDRVEISYGVSETFGHKDKILRKLFAELVEELDAFGPLEKDFLREYVFSNLIRTYIDEVLPGNIAKTAPNKIAHLALAVELITDLDACLAAPSYSSGKERSE